MRSSPQMFRTAFLRTLRRLVSCSFVVWSITVFMLLLMRWNIFSSPKSVLLYYLYKFQNCVEKLQSRTIFLCLFWYVLRKWCFYNYYYFSCFTYRQELMFFVISVRVTSVFFGERNLSLECKPRMLQIIFHTVLCAAISHRTQVWCQLPRSRKHNQGRISLHIFWWL